MELVSIAGDVWSLSAVLEVIAATGSDNERTKRNFINTLIIGVNSLGIYSLGSFRKEIGSAIRLAIEHAGP
jgi:hypothetical protein